MADPAQLTTDGREEAIPAPLAPRPCHEAPALFDPAPFAQQNGQLAADLGPDRFHCSICLGMGAMDDDTEGPWTRGRRPGARRVCADCGGAGWFSDSGEPCGPPDQEGAQWEPGTHPCVPLEPGPLDCDLRPDLESAGAWDDDYLRSIL